jgi:hypothetical protein
MGDGQVSLAFASKYIFRRIVSHSLNHGLVKRNQYNSALPFHIASNFQIIFKHKEQIKQSFNILTLSVGLAKRLTVPVSFRLITIAGATL